MTESLRAAVSPLRRSESGRVWRTAANLCSGKGRLAGVVQRLHEREASHERGSEQHNRACAGESEGVELNREASRHCVALS